MMLRVAVVLLIYFLIYGRFMVPVTQAAEPAFNILPTTGTYEARALIQADSEVTLSTEIAGRIIELPFREGDRFANNQTLIRFDCRAHEGRLQVSLASLKAEKLKLENQIRRAELNSAGALEVGLAEADVEKALGEVATSRFVVDKCHIRAPFQGRIVELSARRHETVSAGAALMRIVDDTRFEVKIVVPSSWLSWLKQGSPFEIRIDETGESVRGKVTRMGAVIDAVSQSLTVFSTLETPGHNLVPGMSGVARFQRPRPAKAGE
ncbi:MAG: HlyD family efflux transporter periplasmic adaptor subunit [Rhodospirillales bacterium]|nr:HlyD family efflux transporter periplasmic adaptor subunit [Rhodospirillales bacterium]